MLYQCWLFFTTLVFLQVSRNVAWMPFWEGGDGKRPGEEVLEALLNSEQTGQESCMGQKCGDSDQCCKGSACVQVEDSKDGTCLPIVSQCSKDSDCDKGYKCIVGTDGRRACDTEREMRKKQFNDECSTSRECDATKGLCCQLQRRHRMAPRKICYYFVDPQGCIGDVDSNARSVPMNFVPHIQNPLFKARLG